MKKELNQFVSKNETTLLNLVSGLSVGVGSYKLSNDIKRTKSDLKNLDNKKFWNVSKIIVKDCWSSALLIGLGISGLFVSGQRAKKSIGAALTLYSSASQALETTKKKLEATKVVSDAVDKVTDTKNEAQTNTNNKKDSKQLSSKPSDTETVAALNDATEKVYFDKLTMRYIKTSWNKIIKSSNDLNRKMQLNGTEVSVNDWLYSIGGTELADCVGGDVVFNASEGRSIDPIKESYLDKDTGEVYPAIDYEHYPQKRCW